MADRMKFALPFENPDDKKPAFTETVIKDLIGPGVTIIGSDIPDQRNILQQQMAVSIATGNRFLEILETRQCGVLYITHSDGDLWRFKRHLGDLLQEHGQLQVQSSWPRIFRGCTEQITEHKSRNPALTTVFLGDFESILSPFAAWFEKSIYGQPGQADQPDLLAKSNLKREMIADNIRRLSRFAFDTGLSIVLGQNLNTQNKLYSWDGLRHRDTEIHILERQRGFELRVVSWSKMPTNSWRLEYDEEEKRFSIKGALKKANQHKKEKELDQIDKTIIDAVIKGEIISVAEIARLAGLKRGRVYKRLEALETKAMGKWVVRIDDSKRRLYMFNSNKKKYW